MTAPPITPAQYLELRTKAQVAGRDLVRRFRSDGTVHLTLIGQNSAVTVRDAGDLARQLALIVGPAA